MEAAGVTTSTAYRTCPLCEATCGLELAIEDDRITRVRGDRDHVFSKGFLCPKGAAFGHLVHDPDRVRRPLVRRGEERVEVSWDEAFAEVDARLRDVVERHGPQSVAIYAGNPSSHTIAGQLYIRPLLKAIGTRSFYSASTVDQMPKHVACGLMYGDPRRITVPDLDRTDYLVVMGANPYESNGSLCTAPDFPGRLEAIQERGGKVVVVDPRRTKTAAMADEHVRIRPGVDAHLLLGIVHTLFDEGLVDTGPAGPYLDGVEDIRRLVAPLSPERLAARCGVPAADVRRLARELAAAPTAAVYARIGTTTVEFGTVTTWLVDVVNALTGNLDRPGGVLFPLAPHQVADGAPGGRGFTTGRWTSRVRGWPEVGGEFPVATLADEILTPGDGQIRALITLAGNPVLSTPHSARLDEAIASLELVVAVDPYVNETTRHADVILPPADSARVAHYDFNFLTFAVRNTAAFSPPVLPPHPEAMDECDVLARLALVASGRGPTAPPSELHDVLVDAALAAAAGDRDAADLAPLVTGDSVAERMVDIAVRAGAYGDDFGRRPGGLTLDVLKANPHGIDHGPLRPRLPGVLRTTTGRVELCPLPIADDVARLAADLDRDAPPLVLVGRRHLRSNNSWMHNVRVLVKGKPRCTLQVHPDDAATTGVVDGGRAVVRSRVGELEADVEVTDEVMPGVVSLPHGWGHSLPGVRMSVAAAHAGVNSNVLTDDFAIDPVSGNAVLNGIPVTVAALP